MKGSKAFYYNLILVITLLSCSTPSDDHFQCSDTKGHEKLLAFLYFKSPRISSIVGLHVKRSKYNPSEAAFAFCTKKPRWFLRSLPSLKCWASSDGSHFSKIQPRCFGKLHWLRPLNIPWIKRLVIKPVISLIAERTWLSVCDFDFFEETRYKLVWVMCVGQV